MHDQTAAQHFLRRYVGAKREIPFKKCWIIRDEAAKCYNYQRDLDITEHCVEVGEEVRCIGPDGTFLLFIGLPCNRLAVLYIEENDAVDHVLNMWIPEEYIGLMGNMGRRPDDVHTVDFVLDIAHHRNIGLRLKAYLETLK